MRSSNRRVDGPRAKDRERSCRSREGRGHGRPQAAGPDRDPLVSSEAPGSDGIARAALWLRDAVAAGGFRRGCQRRLKFSQECRIKIPQPCHRHQRHHREKSGIDGAVSAAPIGPCAADLPPRQGPGARSDPRAFPLLRPRATACRVQCGFQGGSYAPAVVLPQGNPYLRATARRLEAEWGRPTILKGMGARFPLFITSRRLLRWIALWSASSWERIRSAGWMNITTSSASARAPAP